MVGQEGWREDVGEREAGNDGSIVEEIQLFVIEHGWKERQNGEESDVDSSSGEQNDEKRGDIHFI